MNFSVLVLSNPFCLLHMTPSRHSFLRNFKASHPSGPKKKKKNSDSDFVLFLASFISPIERWHYFYTLISNLLSSMLICSLDVRNLLVLASFTWRRKKKHFDLSRLLWIISVDAMPPTSAFQKRDSYFYASTIYELVGTDGHTRTHTDLIYEN